MNEGHGGNRFANLLPWLLDQEALLIRGYPRPMIMSTGIDSTFATMMMLAMHASWGKPGVMAHNYVFADFRVNGTFLNEVGINALVAGEQGVSVSLVSGDDELMKEVRDILGDRVVMVTVKTALGGAAAITWPSVSRTPTWTTSRHVRRTLELSCEAPKFTRLRQLQLLVGQRRPYVPKSR